MPTLRRVRQRRAAAWRARPLLGFYGAGLTARRAGPRARVLRAGRAIERTNVLLEATEAAQPILQKRRDQVRDHLQEQRKQRQSEHDELRQALQPVFERQRERVRQRLEARRGRVQEVMERVQSRAEERRASWADGGDGGASESQGGERSSSQGSSSRGSSSKS